MGQCSSAKVIQLLVEDLGVTKPCIIENDNCARSPPSDCVPGVFCLVPKEWLYSVSTGHKKYVIPISERPQLSHAEQLKILQPSHVGHCGSWLRVKISVLKRPVQYFRLGTMENSGLSTANFYAVFDALAKETGRNKKKCFRKRFQELDLLCNVENGLLDTHGDMYTEDDLPALIQRFFGITFQDIICNENEEDTLKFSPSDITQAFDYWSNLHILPAFAALRSKRAYFLLEPSPQCMLHSALSYSPKVFSTSSSTTMFLVYQLLHIITSYESKGLQLSSSFSLKDIFVSNNLWLFSSGMKFDYSTVMPTLNLMGDVSSYPKIWTELSVLHDTEICNQDLVVYTNLWVTSKITNFEYLLILNKFAGRRLFDPHHHPIMPWVTDFSVKDGGFRDLTKSKFRLKKGDSHLNAIYKAGADKRQSTEVLNSSAPHHLTDVLSDLSFYIYFARRVPKDLLCMHVRPRWEPNEYPQTIRSLYEQASEECIPEFFCDPSVFSSIHSDMNDLVVPEWSQDAQQFISYHRGLLESEYVSSNIHHWIDLVFGYKLTGEDAVRSKNVYFSMVSGSEGVTNFGITPLFSKPHPSKFSWVGASNVPLTGSDDQTDGLQQSYGEMVAVDGSTADVNNYQIIESDQIITEVESVLDSSKESSNDVSISPSNSIKTGNQELITLRDNENFLSELESVEALLKFQLSLGNIKGDRIGDFKFGTGLERDSKKQLLATNLSRSLKLLFCLTVELFLHDKTRPNILQQNLDERTNKNLKLLKANRNELPRWLTNLMANLCGVTSSDASFARNRELPKNVQPSAALNTSFNIFNFPKCFPVLHKFLASLYSVDALSLECVSTQWISKPSNFANPEKIHQAAENLPKVAEELDNEGLELLFKFLMPLFGLPDTKFVSLLHLLYPLGRAVGQLRSVASFLKLVVQAYDDIDPDKYDEIQIFSQGYVSKLITVLGVKTFIEYILPLILDGLLGYHVEDDRLLERSSANFTKPLMNERQRHDSESESSAGSEGETSSAQNSAVFSEFKESGREIVVSFDAVESQGDEDENDSFETDAIEQLDHVDGTTDNEIQSLLAQPMDRNTPKDVLHDETLSLLHERNRLEDVPEERNVVDSSDNDTEFTTPKDNDAGCFQNSEGAALDTAALNVVNETCDMGDVALEKPSTQRMRSVSETLNEGDNELLLQENQVFKQRTDSEESPFTLIAPEFDSDCDDMKKRAMDGTVDNVEDVPFEDSKFEPSFNRTFSDSDASIKPLTVTELCYESVMWLIPWLGPVLTSKYIVRRLLRKLPRLFALQGSDFSDSGDELQQTRNVRDHVIDSLLEIAQVYGEVVILLHYVPFAISAVDAATSAKVVSSKQEGHLISAFTLLHKSLHLLSLDTLLDEIEPLSDKVLQPLLRILSTLRSFQNGHHARASLARILVDSLGMFCHKLGRENAQDALMSLLQQFFSCFDGIYIQRRSASGGSFVTRKFNSLSSGKHSGHEWEGDIVHPDSGGELELPFVDDYTIEDVINNFAICQSMDEATGQESEVASSSVSAGRKNTLETFLTENKLSYEDLYETFSPSLAYYAYILFCRTLGEQYMEKTLYNSELIWQLCANHDERLTLASYPVTGRCDDKAETGNLSDSNILEGIRRKACRKRAPQLPTEYKQLPTENTSSFRSTWQHVTGTWLDLWKDRQEDDRGESFVFRDRKLQTYAGHSAAVKDIYVPENEHYFLSASRDKTVKFWLLKNHGNGTAHLGNTGFYDQHCKPVFAVQSINTKKLVASCDGTVHIWDPITGVPVSKFEPPKGISVVAIRTLPAPHSTVVMATSDGAAKLYDVRQKVPSGEWKTSPVSVGGVVRSLAVPDDASWLAVGFSSGMISVLDMRTGIMRNHWRAQETEILQVTPYDRRYFISTSVNSRTKMWADDGTLAFKLRPPQDTICSVTLCKDKCIWGSSNRIGVYHTLENGAEPVARKISPEVFKSNISKVAVLPVNELFLIGSESGNVMLYD